MKLTVGVSYLAVQEASQIVVSESEKYDFDEKRIEFEVLKKPETVFADDGVSEEEIALPEHLKSDDWYLVKNLDIGNKHWLNTKQYTISILSRK